MISQLAAEINLYMQKNHKTECQVVEIGKPELVDYDLRWELAKEYGIIVEHDDVGVPIKFYYRPDQAPKKVQKEESKKVKKVDSKNHIIYSPFEDGHMEIQRRFGRLVCTIGDKSIAFNSGCIKRMLEILQDEGAAVRYEEMMEREGK